MRDYFYKRPQGQPLDRDDLVFVLCVADIRQQLKEMKEGVDPTEHELREACEGVGDNFEWADQVDIHCDLALGRLKAEPVNPQPSAEVLTQLAAKCPTCDE